MSRNIKTRAVCASQPPATVLLATAMHTHILVIPIRRARATMTISIIRDQSGAMRHHVHIGNHVITVDEETANGGEDTGPNAHDLYDAALGACKALTVLWYAKRKGIPLEDIEVDVQRDASQERAGTYRRDTKLTLGGNLSEAQRQELLNVAGKCPVHKLMTVVTTEITTSLSA